MHLYRKIRKSYWALGKTVYPDRQFMIIKSACERRVRIFERKQPIVLNLEELDNYDKRFFSIYRRMKNYERYYSEYGIFGLFEYYYQEFGPLVECVNELNKLCLGASSNWCDFEMLVTENLQEWIIENNELYERVNLNLSFITHSRFSSPAIANMSYMGIHIPTQDILPMIQFSRLYAEQYAYLLREIPDYDLQTYINQLYPF
jgi:hypothetical protein